MILIPIHRKQKPSVDVALGIFPLKTVLPCVGWSAAFAFTRYWWIIIKSSFSHCHLDAQVMEKIRSKKLEPVCDCKKDCVR